MKLKTIELGHICPNSSLDDINDAVAAAVAAFGKGKLAYACFIGYCSMIARTKEDWKIWVAERSATLMMKKDTFRRYENVAANLGIRPNQTLAQANERVEKEISKAEPRRLGTLDGSPSAAVAKKIGRSDIRSNRTPKDVAPYCPVSDAWHGAFSFYDDLLDNRKKVDPFALPLKPTMAEAHEVSLEEIRDRLRGMLAEVNTRINEVK